MDYEDDPMTLLYSILTAELEAAQPGSTTPPLPVANENMTTSSPSSCSQALLSAGLEATLPGSTTPLPVANENMATSSPSSRNQALLSPGEVQDEGDSKRKTGKHRGGRKQRGRVMRMGQQNQEEVKSKLQRGVKSPREGFMARQRQQHAIGVRWKGRRRGYRERTPLLSYDEPPHVDTPAHQGPSPRNLQNAPRDPLYRQRSRSPSSSLGQQPSGHQPDVLENQSYKPPRFNVLDFRRQATAAAAGSDSQVAPKTAYNLVRYSRGINRYSDNNKRNSRKDDCAKVSVWSLGSTPDKDLGLCYATFLTQSACRSGTSCPWRHHPLSEEEKAWIRGNGRTGFLDIVDDCWAKPGVPVPGANLLKVAERETG